MPPKRDAGATPTPPPVKMIKIGTDVQEFGCDPLEDKYRLAEESTYSPFPNNEVRGLHSIVCEPVSTLVHMEVFQVEFSHSLHFCSMNLLNLTRKMF